MKQPRFKTNTVIMQKSQSFEKVNSDLVIRSHIKESKVKMCHIFKIFKMQLHLQIKSQGSVNSCLCVKISSTSLSIISLEIHRGQHVIHAMHSYHIPSRRAQFQFFFLFLQMIFVRRNKINLNMNLNLLGYWDCEYPLP